MFSFNEKVFNIIENKSCENKQTPLKTIVKYYFLIYISIQSLWFFILSFGFCEDFEVMKNVCIIPLIAFAISTSLICWLV